MSTLGTYPGIGGDPIGYGGTYQFSIGGVDLTQSAKDAGGQILTGLVQWGTDKIVSSITGESKTSGVTQVQVQPSQLVGLAGLYSYMKSNPPPTYTATQAERGDYTRNLATAVMGVPHDTVWANEQSKTDAYELVRGYLAAYDKVTKGVYQFAATIPPHSGTCGKIPCSDSVNAQPLKLYDILNKIGAAGLQAIDSLAAGSLDVSTLDYITSNGSNQTAVTSIDAVLSKLGISITSLVQDAAAAAAGKSTTTGIASLLSNPIVLVVIGLVIWKKVL